MIAINQEGSNQREILKEGSISIWRSDAKQGGRCLAIFNLGDKEEQMTMPFEKLGLSGTYHAKELWLAKEIGEIKNNITLTVAPHGVVLYQLNK